MSELPKDIPEKLLLKFRDYIEEHGGINIESEKFDSLRISIHARATRCGYSSYEEYYAYLLKSEEEFRNLMSLVTVNETYFFRYPEQFRVLREFVLPEIIRENKHRKYKVLKIWSAGCSTGEEPYSIAISVLESIGDIKDWNIYILGTDVSIKALKKAFEGKYGKTSFRITDEEIKSRYFKRINQNTWEISPEVKRLVNFTYHNLIKEPYPLAFTDLWDIIFCRNVTIYFKPESTKRVIENLYKSLRPGGFLFTGHTETLYHINPGFEVIKFGDAFIFRKPAEDLSKRIQVDYDFKAEAQKNHKKIEYQPVKSNELVENILDVIEQRKDFSAEEIKSIYRETVLELLNNNDISSAIREIEKAIKRFPLEAEFYYLRGIALKKLEDFEGAINSFRKAAYLNPDYVYAIVELASIHAFKGDRAEAINQYRRAAKSLNSLLSNDDTKKEEYEVLLRICEMMIKDLEGREEKQNG